MNRKLRQAGFAARGLDDAAICQIASDDSDSFIAEETVKVLALAHGERHWRKLVDVLVKVGRWAPTEGGWIVHDYEEFNFDKAYWAAHQRQKQEAGRRGGQARAKAHAKANGQAPATAPATADAQANAQAASLRFGSPPLVPLNTHDQPGERQQDQDQQQDQPQPLEPIAQQLVDRWLTVIDRPNGLHRAEATRWIPHLLQHLDHRTLDELIGAAAQVTPPPRRITYLAASARDFARKNMPGTEIPAPPVMAPNQPGGVS